MPADVEAVTEDHFRSEKVDVAKHFDRGLAGFPERIVELDHRFRNMQREPDAELGRRLFGAAQQRRGAEIELEGDQDRPYQPAMTVVVGGGELDRAVKGGLAGLLVPMPLQPAPLVVMMIRRREAGRGVEADPELGRRPGQTAGVAAELSAHLHDGRRAEAQQRGETVADAGNLVLEGE